MKLSASVVIATAAVLAAIGHASARPVTERTLVLEFVPQETTSASAPLPFEAALRPVRLVFEDGRPEAERDRVGEGNDDDDRAFPWRTTSSIRGYAKEVFTRTAESWGVRFDETVDLVLLVRLTRFFVTERDQAVGSTYAADVRVAFEVKEHDAHGVAGSASGEARRYGRKRSADNCNEVLSDAMKEAYAGLFDAPKLRRVLRSQPPAPEPEIDPQAEGMSPAKLLIEVLSLDNQGFSPELIIRYIEQQTLTSPLSADDLVEWKKSGLPESVIEAALTRYPAPRNP